MSVLDPIPAPPSGPARTLILLPAPSRGRTRKFTAVTSLILHVRSVFLPSDPGQVRDTKQGRVTPVASPADSDWSPPWWTGVLLVAALFGALWLASALGYWLTGVKG